MVVPYRLKFKIQSSSVSAAFILCDLSLIIKDKNSEINFLFQNGGQNHAKH